MNQHTCAKCRQSKPRSEFYKDKRRATGITSYCKPCHKQSAIDRYYRTQRPERIEKALAPKKCKDCGTVFTPSNALNLYCSEQCRHRNYSRRRNHENYAPRGSKPCRQRTPIPDKSCIWCGAQFTPRHPRHGTCSPECKVQHKGHRMSEKTHRRRALIHSGEYEPIRHRDIYVRDGWICGICGEQIDAALGYPDAMSASLDHIIPLSRGGAHRADNVQAAHLRCNNRKGNRVDA